MKSILYNRTVCPLSNKRSTLTLGSLLIRPLFFSSFDDFPFASRRLIEISEDLEELDLDENVIGHVCGSVILDALKKRKESRSTFVSLTFFHFALLLDKLKKIKINISEKIDQYIFADILKLSVKMKKKKKRAKKKVSPFVSSRLISKKNFCLEMKFCKFLFDKNDYTTEPIG